MIKIGLRVKTLKTYIFNTLKLREEKPKRNHLYIRVEVVQSGSDVR